MKLIEKLNNTSKLLILVIYVILLLGIVLGINLLRPATNAYENYSTIPGDENMDIAVRVKERRTVPSASTDKETQYWDLQVYLHLKDQKAIYRNVTIYTAILKKDGTYKYEEKTASVLTGINNPSNINESATDRGFYSSYSITSKTMTYNSSTKEYTKNNGEPDKVFVKVVYEIKTEGENDVKKSFTYQCDIINTDEVNFNKFNSTNTNDSQNVVLENIKEELSVKVRTELKESVSETDTYRLNVKYFPNDTEEKKIVESTSLAVFLGMKNTESDKDEFFENYIEFAQFHGALPYLYDIPQIATAYSGQFEMDNLYVYAKVNNVDGTVKEDKVYIPVTALPRY